MCINICTYNIFMYIHTYEHHTPQDNACVLNSVIGWRSRVGVWSRVQGTYGANEEHMFAHGKKNPGVTCIGMLWRRGHGACCGQC